MTADGEFVRFAERVSRESNELFDVLEVRRLDPTTIRTTIRLNAPLPDARQLLDHPNQLVRITSSLTTDEGPVYEDPAMEVYEFVATNGIRRSTCVGTSQDGALIIDAREHF